MVETRAPPSVEGGIDGNAAAAPVAEVHSKLAPDMDKSDDSSAESSAVASSASSSGSGDEIEGLVGLADLDKEDDETVHEFVYNMISLVRHSVDTADVTKTVCGYLVDKSIFVKGGAALMPNCKRCTKNLKTR